MSIVFEQQKEEYPSLQFFENLPRRQGIPDFLKDNFKETDFESFISNIYGFSSKKLIKNVARKITYSPEFERYGILLGGIFLRKLYLPYGNFSDIIELSTNDVFIEKMKQLYIHNKDILTEDFINNFTFLLSKLHNNKQKRILTSYSSAKSSDVSFFSKLIRLNPLISKYRGSLLSNKYHKKVKDLSSFYKVVSSEIKYYNNENIAFNYDLTLKLDLPKKIRITQPRNSRDLISWSIEMNNCLDEERFLQSILKGNSYIFGIEIDDNLRYCFQIDKIDGQTYSLMEFKGFSNLSSKGKGKVQEIDISLRISSFLRGISF